MKPLKTVYLFVLQRFVWIFATIFKKWQKWSRISRKKMCKKPVFYGFCFFHSLCFYKRTCFLLLENGAKKSVAFCCSGLQTGTFDCCSTSVDYKIL